MATNSFNIKSPTISLSKPIVIKTPHFTLTCNVVDGGVKNICIGYRHPNGSDFNKDLYIERYNELINLSSVIEQAVYAIDIAISEQDLIRDYINNSSADLVQ